MIHELLIKGDLICHSLLQLFHHKWKTCTGLYKHNQLIFTEWSYSLHQDNKKNNIKLKVSLLYLKSVFSAVDDHDGDVKYDDKNDNRNNDFREGRCFYATYLSEIDMVIFFFVYQGRHPDSHKHYLNLHQNLPINRLRIFQRIRTHGHCSNLLLRNPILNQRATGILLFCTLIQFVIFRIVQQL